MVRCRAATVIPLIVTMLLAVPTAPRVALANNELDAKADLSRYCYMCEWYGVIGLPVNRAARLRSCRIRGQQRAQWLLSPSLHSDRHPEVLGRRPSLEGCTARMRQRSVGDVALRGPASPGASG